MLSDSQMIRVSLVADMIKQYDEFSDEEWIEFSTGWNVTVIKEHIKYLRTVMRALTIFNDNEANVFISPSLKMFEQSILEEFFLISRFLTIFTQLILSRRDKEIPNSQEIVRAVIERRVQAEAFSESVLSRIAVSVKI